ncbi:TPA: hypothetical protein ACH3X2_010246 [Trebouxia sp. C0005]|nr:MAG: hypothetical protein FRX49_04800 [Trebouxia sp. A1-2]
MSCHARLGTTVLSRSARAPALCRVEYSNSTRHALLKLSALPQTTANVQHRRTRRPNCHARLLSRAAAKSVAVVDEDEDLEEEEEFDDEADDGRGLSTEQVTQLMDMLCNETDVAEIDLEMGNFQLHVRRRVDASAGAASQSAASSSANPAVLGSTSNFDFPPEELDKFAQDHNLNGGSARASTEDSDDDDYNENLVYVSSPKVGILRRGKYFKGKKVGKGNAVNEGDKVKKGQTVAYIEQLGTFVPVEAPQAGEAVEFLIEEGKPVEFREEVVSLAPFFGGHIIGDAKYS